GGGGGHQAVEAAPGGSGDNRLLVGARGARRVLAGGQGGQPAVRGGAAHAVVEERAAQELVETAARGPIESRQSRPALERHVHDGRLAEARAGRAHALYDQADPGSQLVGDLIGARVEAAVGDQLEGGDGRRRAHWI